jgi:DNA-binding NarL/FixJ family response regulator
VLLDVSIPLLNGVRVAQIVKRDHPAVSIVMMSEQDIPVLKLMAEAAGTPHFLAKSRLAVDLIPLLTSLEKAAGNPKGAYLQTMLGLSFANSRQAVRCFVPYC